MLPPLRFKFVSINCGCRTAPLRRDSRHAGAAKTIQHDVTRFSVVQDRRHDRKVWNLGVIRVRLIDRIGLADLDVNRLRLTAVPHARVVRLAIVAHEFFEKGIRARGVVRRV